MNKRTGRKPESEPLQRLTGHRMRLAAEQAGYRTTVAMAEAMGVANSVVSRWWRGENLPNMEDMARYADLVGKRRWWFYVDSTDDEFDLVADALTAIIDGVMSGRDLAASHNQVTGESDRFGRQERAALAAGTPGLRGAVTRAAEGDWQSQSPRRRRQVVDRLAEEALRGPEK